jgi:hypothetical protein
VSLETKVIVAAVLLLAGLFGYATWSTHEQHKGEAKCESADSKAAAAQLKAITAERDAYAQLLDVANASLKDAQGKLAAAAAGPVPHLVCHQANPQPVRQVPAETDGGLATPGAPDLVRASDFDPGPDLDRLSRAYEQRVEGCRDALNRWPVHE